MNSIMIIVLQEYQALVSESCLNKSLRMISVVERVSQASCFPPDTDRKLVFIPQGNLWLFTRGVFVEGLETQF